ncbi:hypothetical protein SUGI_0858600 [Cryptomeria japonica]|nr:hypothetical protein SUGI_0858600 [Cryptomeria japonica]
MIGRTTVVIAHRSSTIKNVDTIVVMKDGFIVEMGSHDQLMAKKGGGAYFSLVNLQAPDYSNNDKDQTLQGMPNPSNDKQDPSVDAQIYESNGNEKEKLLKMGLEVMASKDSTWRLLKMSVADWPYAIMGIFGSIILGCLVPMIALFMAKSIANFFIQNHSEMERKIRITTFVFLGIALAALLGYSLQQFCLGIIGANLSKRVREKMLAEHHQYRCLLDNVLHSSVAVELSPPCHLSYSCLALVGSSGCGKSSIIALIERFYDPTEGTVFIDQIDIRSYHLRSLRLNISLVQQEPALFATSIRDNIVYGKENATEEEVINATRITNAHEFISKLPDGYGTLVAERGVEMSGGQKQRIAIARAVLKNPAILLLDEATSGLDAESERVVQEALERVVEGRTSIVVAHRLSTIKNVTTIAVVKDGRIAEQGSHAELMATPHGEYSRLLNLKASHQVKSIEQ